MSKNNSVEQKVSLNTKEYTENLKKMNATSKQESTHISKSVENIKTSYRSLNESVKKDSLGLNKTLKGIQQNIVRGGSAIAAGVGFVKLTDSIKNASQSSQEFDRNFSRMTQRFDFSEQKIKKLRGEYRKLADETGGNGGDITAAASNLLSANGGIDKGGLGLISKFAQIEDGVSAEDVSRKAVDHLKGSGKEVNQANIKEFLEATLALQRKGDFNLKEALGLTSGADGNSLARAGISDKENAALLAGSSNVGQDRASTTAAMQALIEKSVDGFGKGSALQGILGVEGGSLLKDGKFDVSKLGEAAKGFNKRGLNSQDSVALLEQGGLSNQEAEGLYSILKDFDKFHKGFQNTLNDQKTIEKAFKESTNNMPDALSKLQQKIISGVDEIMSPLSKVGTKLISGDYKGAIADTPGALVDSAKGVGNNKMLAFSALGGMGMAGGLLKKTGLFGGVASGIAKGQAIEKATGDAVQSVYVVNANEIGGGDTSISGGKGKYGKFGKMLKGAGKSALGLAAGAGKLALGGAGVAAAGAVGYGAGTLLNDHVVDKFQTKSKDGFEGNIVEQMFHKLDQLVGGENSKKHQEATKILLELDSKDNGFKVKPVRDAGSVQVEGM